MSKFDPANWKRHGNYYFRHKETDKVIHEETYYGKLHKLKEEDIEDFMDEYGDFSPEQDCETKTRFFGQYLL